MKFDLSTIRTAVTVGAGVAELLGRVVADVAAVQHDPAALGDLLADLSDGVPEIISAVKTGTVAAFEPTIEPAAEPA